MSDDLVNQITLNFLISKQQLQKLNKKIKQKEEDKMKTDMDIYKDQVVDLFFKMINNELPDDLLEDVKHSYTYFVEKSIYYLKMKTSNNDTVLSAAEDLDEAESSGEDDLEADELSASEEESSEDEDTVASSSAAEEADEESSLEGELNNTNKGPILITQFEPKTETRYKKFTNTKSKGIDDIQHLPLDWFSKVRQTYKQNQIIPRHKDANTEISSKGVVIESPTNYKNTEKKNINTLYEDKTNDKNKKTKQ